MNMETESISDLLKYNLFIFDLDNTIINEEDYLFQGYKAVAGYIASELPGVTSEFLNVRLTELYLKNGRYLLFDRLVEELGCSRDIIAASVNVLRTFSPVKKIEIKKNTAALLTVLRENKKTAYILTNGNPLQQKNKINNISWGTLAGFPVIVYAADIVPKPSPAGVEHILQLTGFSKPATLMIGDSDVDRLCAEAAGVTFINISSLS